MSWWQIGLTALLPWVFERVWTIKGLKKVPKKLQPAIEEAAAAAVREAIRRGNDPSPATPMPRPGKK